MFYTASLAIPANTAKTAPVEARVKLSAGYITHVTVVLRDEAEFLAHVQIHGSGGQIYPTNLDGDISTSVGRNEIVDQYQLTPGNTELVIRGWNTDDSYQHTAYVQFTVLPAALVEAGQASLGILQRLQRLIFG